MSTRLVARKETVLLHHISSIKSPPFSDFWLFSALIIHPSSDKVNSTFCTVLPSVILDFLESVLGNFGSKLRIGQTLFNRARRIRRIIRFENPRFFLVKISRSDGKSDATIG